MKYLSFLAVIIFLGVGCASAPPPVDLVQPPLVEPPQIPSQQTFDPLSNPQGIYYHAVYFASSQDGESWQVGDLSIAEHASVPDLTVLQESVGSIKAGTLVSYFVDSAPLGEGQDEAVSFITSTDNGVTWSERTQIHLDQELLPVDPSVVQLEDGRLRMHFFDFSSTRVIGEKGPFIFYSAISGDGINFTIEGPALSSDTLMTDPEVVQLNSEWFMYFAMHEEEDLGVWVATSTDGITFENPQKISQMAGIPGAMVIDGEVHLYGCDAGIVKTSSTDGVHFAERPEPVEKGLIGKDGKKIMDYGAIFQSNKFFCDPSPAILPDGSVGLMIKSIVDNEGVL